MAVLNIGTITSQTQPVINSFVKNSSNTQLSWSTTNATSCTLSGQSFNNLSVSVNGTQPMPMYSFGSTVGPFTLNCTGSNGQSVSNTITAVNTNTPSSSFTSVNNNGTVALNWQTNLTNNANMCTLYRHSGLGPTDGSYDDSTRVLITTNLGNSGSYSTPYIGTAGNWAAPGFMQLTLDCGGVKFYTQVAGLSTNGNNNQSYYNSALGAQVTISGRTLTLAFSGTGNACYAGTVNFGDGTSSAYSPSGANCNANVVKTYTNAGQYQILKTINGVMSGTAFVNIQ
jgi:hypothetical protein